MEKDIIVPKNKDYKYWIRTVLVIFFAIQPLLDVYMTLFDDYIQIVGVSLATILRFGVVFALLVTVLFFEFKRKSTLVFFCYSVLVLVYIVFHHFNATTFSIELANSEYNVLNELLYIARMCIPSALIYIIYIVRLRYNDIKKILVFSSLTISIVIIVSNLFNVGYISYSLEDRVILDNMVSWFTGEQNSINWQQLSCRGFFQASNPLSGVVLMLTPSIIYISFVEKRIKYWLVVALQFIAMINISTRIATIGGIAVLAGIVAIYILEQIIHGKIVFRKIFNKTTVSCAVSCFIIVLVLLNSPFAMRAGEGGLFADLSSVNDSVGGMMIDNSSQSSSEKNDPEEDDEILSQNPEKDDPDTEVETNIKQQMISYIEQNWTSAPIHEYHIKTAYPYKDDPEFWYHVIKDVPDSERYGNRNMRKLMLDRILERDDRFSNTLLGISHTRSSMFVWPERDFETQLDSLGIIGTVIFLGPYVLIALFGIYNFFKKFTKNLHLKKCVYLITLGLGMFTAYMSGHIMNEIFPSIYLAMFSGIVLCTCLGDYSSEHIDEN